MAAGGDNKDAKFNGTFKLVGMNIYIIEYAFLQVCHPGLHISLGWLQYLKFFNKLENECHHLDLKIEGRMAHKSRIGRFQLFCTKQQIYQQEVKIGQKFSFHGVPVI